MRISVPIETAHGERRVALVPESCKKLIASGYEVSIESGAGEAARYSDDEYRESRAAVGTDPASLLGAADLVPSHASLLFSRNLTAFQLDLNDEIQQGALITYDGEVRHARTRDALQKAEHHEESMA